MRNIILVAPPAAGKGTQAKLLSSKYHLPHISTGDLLRNITKEDSELARKIKSIMESGGLVTDDIVLELLENRIQKEDCQDGYILDGFPRNLNQAVKYMDLLEKLHIPIGDIIYFDIPYDILRRRIVGRLSCSSCGAVYNDQFEESKPQQEGICDACHNELSKRLDDNDETFAERYKVYQEQTHPILAFFQGKANLFTIGSNFSKEETFHEIEKIINRGNL